MEHHVLLVYAGISSILSHYVVFHIACLRCIFQWIVSFGDVLSSFAIFDLIDFYQPNFIPEQNMHHVLDIILLVFSNEFFAFHWPIWSASGGRQDHVEFANSLFFSVLERLLGCGCDFWMCSPTLCFSAIWADLEFVMEGETYQFACFLQYF